MKDLRQRCERLAGIKSPRPSVEALEAFAIQIRNEAQKPLIEALNEVDHVMNWNADHICRCFTQEHPKRNPNCQYHRIAEITRVALALDALRELDTGACVAVVNSKGV